MEKMGSIELKPCPCCGGSAEIKKQNIYNTVGFRVCCTNCHISTSVIFTGHPADIAEVWNKRIVADSEKAGDDGVTYAGGTVIKQAHKSKVYTDRPAYADFDAPHKFEAIKSIIAKMYPKLCWIPVSDRLPEKGKYDWVLVKTDLFGGSGIPYVAEQRNGVWYCDYCNGPMEETLNVKVVAWFDMQTILEETANANKC